MVKPIKCGTCGRDVSRFQHVIKKLPDTQAEAAGRHKCAVAAYEAGYKQGTIDERNRKLKASLKVY